MRKTPFFKPKWAGFHRLPWMGVGIAAGLLVCVQLTFANTSGAVSLAFSEIKSLYDAEKYEDALQLLQKTPAESASDYYNLGTLYLKMGRVGSAVAYLEKANSLRPHDSDTQHNLQLAQSQLGKTIGADRLDPVSSPVESIADNISLDEVRGALGLIGLIVVLSWVRSYMKTRRIRETLLKPSGILGLCGFVIVLGLYGAQRISRAQPPAVLIERQVIRSGPGEHYLDLGQAEAGSKVRLSGQSESAPGSNGQSELWQQVRYRGTDVGWVRGSSLLIL